MEVYDRGLRLKTLREKRGLSQREVADRLGVTRATVSGYECNIKAPKLETLERMAVLYRTSVDYILGLDHRTSIYLDDLSESQQQAVIDIVDRLREAFQSDR